MDERGKSSRKKTRSRKIEKKKSRKLMKIHPRIFFLDLGICMISILLYYFNPRLDSLEEVVFIAKKTRSFCS